MVFSFKFEPKFWVVSRGVHVPVTVTCQCSRLGLRVRACLGLGLGLTQAGTGRLAVRPPLAAAVRWSESVRQLASEEFKFKFRKFRVRI